MPVGTIRLTDEVGIDIPYKVMTGMGITQNTLKKVVESGRLGLKKSGKGFFLKDGRVDPDVLPLIVRREPIPRSESEIQNGIFESMVLVGKDLLDRRIVDDVRMIDAGLIWGLGFPADKGGPMKWADLTGLSKKLQGRNFYQK
jgi:3-hydroxyacyl-CoA dehydrogenase